jgi:hypothetical protein
MRKRLPPPDREPPDAGQVGPRLARGLKAAWAVTIATLLFADLTLPRMVELQGWHDLIDRCLGKETQQQSNPRMQGHLVRDLPPLVQ